MIRTTNLAETFGKGVASVEREVEEELVAAFRQVSITVCINSGFKRAK
jgi:hypothetical protein